MFNNVPWFDRLTMTGPGVSQFDKLTVTWFDRSASSRRVTMTGNCHPDPV
ncbi:MAG: hypothetical protein IEMM0002_1466 [bacterium]|nr:MAG: hypothetical protein IEMM0002_1466 [bacterium]